MKSKILIICPFTSPNQGGVESHIQKLVKFIGKKGRQVLVFTYQPLTTPVKAPTYEKQGNYEIYRMPWFGTGWFPKIEHNFILTFLYLVPGLLFLSLVIGFQRRSEYGVIHSHGFAAGLIGIGLKLLTGKRLVLSTHAIYDLKNRPFLARILKIILHHCDFILAVGEPSRQEIIELGISPSRVAVHPNWVDTDFFKPTEQKNKKTKKLITQLPNYPITILFVGRALEKKGIFLFGDLAKQNPQLKFVARVGDGPDLKRFLETYSQLENLEIRTELPQDFEQKMQILRDEYQSSDIFIMPSLYAEGFAAVVLEAASSGLAIISSNLGCLPDMLTGSGAILIQPTLQNFDKQLKSLIPSTKMIPRLQTEMRNFSLKNFSEANAEIIYNSYQIS